MVVTFVWPNCGVEKHRGGEIFHALCRAILAYQFLRDVMKAACELMARGVGGQARQGR